MENTMKLSRTNKAVKALLARTFPEYKGRKVSARISPTYYVDAAGGGTFARAFAVNAATGAVAEAQRPFSFVGDVEIPADHVIVEHSYFCGQDAGITIYVRPENAPKMLTEVQ